MTHTFAFEIDYAHECSGWMDCVLVIDGVTHHIPASGILPPFMKLLRFVKAAAMQRLPARFTWEEEGPEDKFEAKPVADDPSLMHLKIDHVEVDELPVTWFDDIIERDLFVRAFLPPLMDFSHNCLISEADWRMPKPLVAMFYQEIVSGHPLRSDTHMPQLVECRVKESAQGYKEAGGDLRFWFEEQEVTSTLIANNSPSWMSLVEFMGDIAYGTMQAAWENLQVDQWYIDVEETVLFISKTRTRLVAEPVDIPENFRLKVFTCWQDEPDFLLLEEVVDRRRFVQGFADSFKKFLDMDYQMMPDENGKMLDLRSLPLEKLFHS